MQSLGNLEWQEHLYNHVPQNIAVQMIVTPRRCLSKSPYEPGRVDVLVKPRQLMLPISHRYFRDMLQQCALQ
jgi:hypothetical protein